MRIFQLDNSITLSLSPSSFSSHACIRFVYLHHCSSSSFWVAWILFKWLLCVSWQYIGSISNCQLHVKIAIYLPIWWRHKWVNEWNATREYVQHNNKYKEFFAIQSLYCHRAQEDFLSHSNTFKLKFSMIFYDFFFAFELAEEEDWGVSERERNLFAHSSHCIVLLLRAVSNGLFLVNK